MTDADLPLVHEWVPPRAESSRETQAVVVLHGRGADEHDLLPIAREFPETYGALSLRAPDSLGPGYTWYEFETAGNDIHTSQPVDADFRRSLDLVEDSIVAATEAYDLDRDRNGLLGFSQGAIMSFALLLEAPVRYAWCAGLHGYLAESHAALEPDGVSGKPVFVGAGSRDQVIPVERAERAAERFEALGADVTFRTYGVGHGVGRRELEDLVEWVRALPSA